MYYSQCFKFCMCALTQIHFLKNGKLAFDWFPLGLKSSYIFISQNGKMAKTTPQNRIFTSLCYVPLLKLVVFVCTHIMFSHSSSDAKCSPSCNSQCTSTCDKCLGSSTKACKTSSSFKFCKCEYNACRAKRSETT